MKVKFYLAMTAVAFLMSNCSQDEPLTQTKNSTNTLTAFIENASRSTVSDGGVFSWNEDDAIAVGNADGNYTKFVYGNETFTAETGIVPKGYAIYPYNEAYLSLPDGTALPDITLAESYEYGSTNAPMLATISENATSLTFNHLAGLMRFRVKNVPNTATEFSLTAEGKDITGLFTPTTDNDGKTCIEAGENGTKNEVKITFTTVKEVMDFYVPMPVGEYTSLKVKIGEKELPSNQGVTNTIARGKLLLMPTMVYDETNGLTLEGGNNVSLNANEEVDLNVNGGEEVVVEIAQGTTATLNLTAPENSSEGLTISDGSEDDAVSSQTSAGTLNVSAKNASTLKINTPTLTVKLTSGEYEKVEALTAQQTLIIGEGVKIGELVLNGGNVKLEGDLELSTPLVIGVETTIDLNGHTIKPADTSMTQTLNTKDALILVRKGGNLTITDTSKEGNGRIDTGNNSSIYGAIKMTDSADEESGNAILTIQGGTIKGYYYGIMGNGNGGNRNGTVITMTDGTIEEGYCTDDNTGIFHPQLGTLTISGGNITGYMSAVEMRSGTLTISNGTFISTGSPAAAAANGNGNTITGAAIAISQHTTNQELKAEISGGTFNGVYALYEEDKQDENVSNISMSVTGGTFNGSIFTENCMTAITGGTFLNASAFDYLGNDANVTLGDDMTLTKAVTITQKATINLNGKTIKNNTHGGATAPQYNDECVVFYVNGTTADLTIEGEGNVLAIGPNSSDTYKGQNDAGYDATKNFYNVAVWVENGAKATIKGGYYENNADGNGDGCDLIYAKNGSTISVTGGTFKAGAIRHTLGNGIYAALNCRDNSAANQSTITVSGGKFWHYGAEAASKVGNNEVILLADGYKWSDEEDSNGYYSVVQE